MTNNNTLKKEVIGKQNIFQFAFSFIPHIHFFRIVGKIQGSYSHIGKFWNDDCEVEIRKCVCCGKEQGRSTHYENAKWLPMLSDLKLK